MNVGGGGGFVQIREGTIRSVLVRTDSEIQE